MSMTMATKRRSAVNRLPNELLARTVEVMDSMEDIKSTSLANRNLRAICRSFLFNSIYIDSRKTDAKCKVFLDLLERTPSVVKATRRVWVTLEERECLNSDNTKIENNVPLRLILLRNFQSVTHLTLSGFKNDLGALPSQAQEAFEGLLRAPSLRQVSIRSLILSPPMWKALSRVDTLEMAFAVFSPCFLVGSGMTFHGVRSVSVLGNQPDLFFTIPGCKFPVLEKLILHSCMSSSQAFDVFTRVVRSCYARSQPPVSKLSVHCVGLDLPDLAMAQSFLHMPEVANVKALNIHLEFPVTSIVPDSFVHWIDFADALVGARECGSKLSSLGIHLHPISALSLDKRTPTQRLEHLRQLVEDTLTRFPRALAALGTAIRVTIDREVLHYIGDPTRS